MNKLDQKRNFTELEEELYGSRMNETCKRSIKEVSEFKNKIESFASRYNC